MGFFGGKDTSAPAPSRPSSRSDAPSSGLGGSLIGKQLILDGKITGEENVIIEGTVKGVIDLKADLRIGKSARVESKVHARNVIVEGVMVGDLSADNRVELVNGASVDGNIKAPKVVVAEGAKFRGNVDMGAGHGKDIKQGETKESV